MFAAPHVDDLNAAFEAVWKAPAPVAVQAAQPGDRREQLFARPVLLAPLGGDRYVLAVKESNRMLAHGATGAVSLAYVARQDGSWRPLGSWREVTWIGETGGEGITVRIRRDLGARPLLLVLANTVFQGDEEQSAAVVRLDEDSPVTLGVLPLDGDDTGGEWPDVTSFSYRARIIPDRGAFLAVHYQGWTAPGFQKRQTPFQRTIAFRVVHGCLAPVGKLKIPGGQYAVAAGCAAAASSPSPRPAGTAARIGRAPGARG